MIWFIKLYTKNSGVNNMNVLVLLLFTAALILCVLAEISVVYALLFGFCLFFSYGLWQKKSVKQMIQMSWSGLRNGKNILTAFFLIGIITAVWRASGTIAMIIYGSTALIIPSIFILITFLLNCFVSVLIGTAFGTSATMGVICMTIGTIMGINPAYLGGAIISGAYFGDRCSPMSTSALLVSEMTETNVFDNIRNMIKTSWIPFSLVCIIYLILGLGIDATSVSLELINLFAENFNLHWVTMVPAGIIIIFSLFKINLKRTLFTSIVLGSILCLTLQGMELPLLLKTMVWGYESSNPTLAPVINGGGLQSMMRAGMIVSISYTCSGIFEGTQLLMGLKNNIQVLATRITPYGGMVVTAIATSMVACNQTLAIILTNDLCKEIVPDKKTRAIHLENTAVLIAGLVPWSIAGAVPMDSVGAPTSSLLFACYLYLVPITQFIVLKFHKNKQSAG